MTKKVAFQGVSGAYSELAAKKFFGERVFTQPVKHFDNVFSQVMRKKVDFGIIPIENSLAGSIHQNYDLLLKNNVWICGEYKLQVSHNLLGLGRGDVKKVRTVYSHPQALSQCAGYLKSLKKVEEVPYFDTAGSAQYIAERQDPSLACIASAEAGRHFGLKVLKGSIEDNHLNFTRFFVLQNKGAPKRFKTKTKYKTSVVFALKNIAGALYKSLSIFAIRDIDLLKIESRPIPGSPWKYIFYLDFAGKSSDKVVVNTLGHLGEISQYLKVLGSYPAN